MKVILREIEKVKFETQIFKLLTLCAGGPLRETLSSSKYPNGTNRKEYMPFQQQFKVNIGKLDQEYALTRCFNHVRIIVPCFN